MVLTVEDGSGVENADSYVTLADARLYALSRGVSLSSDDTDAEVQLRRAFDYVESYRASFKGAKTTTTQTSQWPRAGVYVDGVELASDGIPVLLRNAQVQAAAAIAAGLDLLPNTTGASFVVHEKVGQIETRYSERNSTSGVPILRVFDMLLAPLLSTTGLLTTARA